MPTCFDLTTGWLPHCHLAWGKQVGGNMGTPPTKGLGRFGLNAACIKKTMFLVFAASLALAAARRQN